MSQNDVPNEPAPEVSDTPDRIAALEQALADAEARAEQSREAQLRAAAELDNTRRRLEREAQNTARFAAEGLLRDLLSVVDSLELGLKAAERPEAQIQALTDGMALTHKQFGSLLEKQGVTVIDPAGQPFDPEAHQAMSMIESADVAPNHVLSVMQKGYLLHGRLLRPAMVVVAKAPTNGDPGSD